MNKDLLFKDLDRVSKKKWKKDRLDYCIGRQLIMRHSWFRSKWNPRIPWDHLLVAHRLYRIYGLPIYVGKRIASINDSSHDSLEDTIKRIKGVINESES